MNQGVHQANALLIQFDLLFPSFKDPLASAMYLLCTMSYQGVGCRLHCKCEEKKTGQKDSYNPHYGARRRIWKREQGIWAMPLNPVAAQLQVDSQVRNSGGV